MEHDSRVSESDVTSKTRFRGWCVLIGVGVIIKRVFIVVSYI